MQCPKCKANVGRDDRFCMNCGLNLVEWYASANFQIDEPEQQPEQNSEQDYEPVRDPFVYDGDPYNQRSDPYGNSGDPYVDIYDDPYSDPYRNSKADPYAAPEADPYGEKSQPKVEKLKKPIYEQKKKQNHAQDIYQRSENNLEPAAQQNGVPAETQVSPQDSAPVQPVQVQGKKKVPASLIVIGLGVVLGLGGYLYIQHGTSGSTGNQQVAVADQEDAETKESQEAETQENTENSDDAAEQTDVSESGWKILDEGTAQTVSLEGTASETQESEEENADDASESKTSGSENTDSADNAEESQTSEAEEEPEASWADSASLEKQDAVLSDGTYLDRNYLTSLMDASKSRYGVYILDVTNFVDYSVGNGDTPLPASALIGIPIMFTIAEGVDSGDFGLSDAVTFSYTFENGRGTFTSADNGKSYSLQSILTAGLTASDNNAWNSLIDFLTLDRINNTCHEYGYYSVDLQRGITASATDKENYISAKDAAMMVNAIYQGNFSGIDADFLRNNFKISASDSANKGMYPACKNAGVFLNLNGITETRYNEVGLVENGDEVFIIAALTVDGKNETSAPCITNEAAYVLSQLKAGVE